MDHTGTEHGTLNGTRSEQRGERTTKTEAEAEVRTTSSRTDAQTARARDAEESITSRIRRTPQAVALARNITDIRPEWSAEDVYAWALRDERPWSDVVAAGINGARDRSIRQVGGLQFAGPAAPSPVMTYLSGREALAEAEDRNICEHGGIVGRCPLCRGAA